MMKPSLFLSVLLLAFSSFRAASSSALDDVCSRLGESYVTLDFCKTVLSADPRSKTAPDAQAVALIAIDITAANAVAASSVAEAQARKSADSLAKRRALAAFQILSDQIESLRWANGFVGSKKYRTAFKLVSLAVEAEVATDGHRDLEVALHKYVDAAFVTSAILGNI